MKIGKLTTSQLKKIIFKYIDKKRDETISNSDIGNDCAAVQIADGILYLSSDPITGTSTGIGKLLVNVNCNDIATTGCEAIGIMLTILAPPETTEEEIENIMLEIKKECDKLNIDILGGHTEITKAVNQIVTSATVIAYLKDKKEALLGNVKLADNILITKGVGIEGIGIIAYEKEEELKNKFGEDFVIEAKKKLEQTSVVKDGITARKRVKAMHDATEGGLLGAIWEMSEYYGLGVELYQDKIIIDDITRKICEFYEINPLRLISSGTMIMIVDDENISELQRELRKNSIENYTIGKIIKEGKKVLLTSEGEEKISEPESDELFKVV